MAPKRDAGSEAPETLDAASAQNLERVLNHADKRRNTSQAPFPASANAIHRRTNTTAAVCGAPAVAAEQNIDTTNKTPANDDDLIDLTKDDDEELARPHAAAAGGHGNASDDDWEDIAEEEDLAAPGPSKKPSRQGITINLGGKGTTGVENEEDEAGPSRRRRAAYTKEDREIARLVHQSHVLCLLGRGLLYDAAADDSLLQAAALSVIPASRIESITKGISSVDEKTQHQALEKTTRWFRVNFTLLKKSSMQPPAENVDEIGAAIAQAKGVEGISQQLLEVVESRCGTAEELSTIFAAMLRSLGCLVRTVRLFEPSSLKPGDAIRQQEQALKNYMKRKTTNDGGGGGGGGGRRKVNELAQAAADLLDGTESRRRENYVELINAQCGLPSGTIKLVPGGIMVDPRKLKQHNKDINGGGGRGGRGGRGRGGAASGGRNGAAGGSAAAGGSGSGGGAVGGKKKRNARTAFGPADDEKEIERKKNKQALEKEAPTPSPAKKTGGVPGSVLKNKMRRSKGGIAAVAAAEKEAAATTPPPPPPAADAAAEEGAELASDEAEKQQNKKNAANTNANTTKTRVQSPEEPAKKKLKRDDDGFCEGGIPLHDVQEKHPTPRKKRRGDEEFERELEVAMAATDFERQPTRPAVEDDAAAGGSGGGSGSTRGAAFGSHQGHVGRYWVEVYCGSSTSGRWVHVCPISGWVDRAEDVEGLAPRGHSLAYVVAYGGGGGAKDVTRRYASSFLNAEKQREGEWWDNVMKPLRIREVAALSRLPTAAAGGNVASTAAPTAPNTKAAAAAGPSGSSPAVFQRQQQQQQQRQQQQDTNQVLSPALATLREDKELEQRAAAERLTLPTTIDGFKTHPTLILSRHITKYQALEPGSKVLGTHKGEPYYNRADVGDVNTAEKWKRMGREVLPEELGTPVKRMKKRKPPQVKPRGGRYSYLDNATAMALAGGGGRGGGRGGRGGGRGASSMNTNDVEEEEEEEEMSDFYGIWQTRGWAPDAAVNGRVPKNDRGNVEVPPFASALPAGTVHINLQGVAAICRKLDVDYAPALTGFDIRAGRSVPSIEGVVVCTEYAAAVHALWEQETARRAQQAIEKKNAEAEKAWRELLRALLTRVRLENAYGGGNTQTGTAEGEAAAMLAHGAGQAKLKRGTGSAGAGARAFRRDEEQDDDGNEDDLADVKVEEI